MIRLLTMLMVLALSRSCAGADAATLDEQVTTVTLFGTARLPAGKDITIADVAKVEGPGADLLGPLVLRTTSDLGDGPWLRIERAEIVRAASTPRHSLLVRGAVCRVRVIAKAPPPLVRTEAGKIIESFDGPILRDHIRARLCAQYGVEPDDLRLTFDDADAQLIRTPTVGRTVEVQPLGESAQTPIAVTLYEGESIVLSETLRVGVQVRREVLVAKNPIARRAPIQPGSYERKLEWVDPTITLATDADMEGATARTSLEPGDVIELHHVEPPIVVKRGDLVTVRCLAGNIVAKISARALDDGHDGESIRFEPMNGGRRFYATMSGAGRAVLSTADAEGKIR